MNRLARLYFRLISMVPLVMGLGIGYFSWHAALAGEWLATAIFAMLAAFAFYAVIWCWKKERSADDIEP